MNDKQTTAIVAALNRVADSQNRVAEAQEENNKILREDIALIQDLNLDEIVDEYGQSH